MDPIQEHPIRRFEDGCLRAAGDPVVVESRIELNVNDGQLRLAMLALPRDLEALAVGFLLGEGVLRKREELSSVEALPDEGRVDIRGDFDSEALENIRLRWTWGTGCGGGGTSRDLDASSFTPVGPGLAIPAPKLLELAKQFEQRADLWRRTGGVHACALADGEAVRLYAEDVGRHNAFDKIMGRALLDGIDLGDTLVLATGRLSAEIVSKAVACGVPIIASRSCVTGLAIQLARRFGVTLVGFLRAKRLNVYTGFERILEEKEG